MLEVRIGKISYQEAAALLLACSSTHLLSYNAYFLRLTKKYSSSSPLASFKTLTLSMRILIFSISSSVASLSVWSNRKLDVRPIIKFCIMAMSIECNAEVAKAFRMAAKTSDGIGVDLK